MTRGVSHPRRALCRWVLEHYWLGFTRDLFHTAMGQVCRTAEAKARDGTLIRLRHAMLVPADEAAYGVIDAASEVAVEELDVRAGVPFDRILTGEEV